MTVIRRKRSGRLALGTMLAGAASISVAGCDQPGSPTQWDQAQSSQGEQVQAYPYRSLETCKAADEVPDSECDTAFAAAQKDDASHSPRFDSNTSCEDMYGAGNCVPRTASNGGSFFTPLLAGFVVGQMLNNVGQPYYRGSGLYQRVSDRDGYGGGWYTGWGSSLSRDYSTGRTVIARDGIDPPAAIRQAPPRVQTRTAVVSRGGFGGGRSFGHGFGG